MQKVKVIGFSATITQGEVILSPAQAFSRLEQGEIRETGKEGVYEVIGRIQFKFGEEFGYSEELSPAMEGEMLPMKAAVKELKLLAKDELEQVNDRIAEIEARGEEATEDELAELAALKAKVE